MHYWLSFTALLFAGMVHAQVPGSIRDAAVPPINPLDPNGDGFITSTGVAFSGPSDEAQFELPFIPLQQYEHDPASDNQYSPGCQFYELVNDAATGADAGYYYYSNPDGIPDNGDELILFRVRVGRHSNGSTAFSFLLDTDYRFGFVGPEADPNAVSGNPGFEKEIAVFNNTGTTGGVRVFNVDGTSKATIVDYYAPITSHYQVATALNNDAACGSDRPVFIDMYVPFAAVGISSTQQIRMAVAANEDIASALNGGADDIGGVNGNLLPNDDDQFIRLITKISPVGITNPLNQAPVAPDASVNLDEHSSTGTIVHTVSATDPNADVLNYSITGGNPFNTFVINPTNGVIQVNNAAVLNYETTSLIQLTVAVSDGRLYDNAIITIQLRDLNEAPSLTDATIYIEESRATGSPVFILTGTDPDAGAILTYSILSGNLDNTFSINPNTGELKINGTLDFESVNTYNLIVRVTDGSLADDALINVYVSDVNEAPVATDVSVLFPENSPAGTSVTTIIASDPDVGSVMQFSITAGNIGSAFYIDPSSGELKVSDSQLLNFEATPSYTLTVRVTDGLLSDDVTITIGIGDVNEPPTITDAIVNVDENALKDIVVFTVQAFDPDAGSQLVFTITSGNEGDVFLINASGQLVLSKPELDFELKNVFNLSIQVSDGVYLDDASLTIQVNDVNEPPLSEGASVQVEETTLEGSTIHSVIAHDPDAGAVLQYAIVEGNSDEAFVIDEVTGAIAVNRALDFETVPVFHLTIRVSDGVLSSQAVIDVDVSDVNEAPVVHAAVVNLQQPVDPEEVLYIVVASDPDKDDVLTFSIEGTDAEPVFAIEPTSGEISMVGRHASSSTPITSDLQVTATDREGLSGNATIQINLLPIRELTQVRPRKGFSPNGDGQNDFWLIEGIEAFPDNVIHIYNRWGMQVSEVRGYDNAEHSWRGEISGAPSNTENTYFYIIKVPEFEPITGYVILKP